MQVLLRFAKPGPNGSEIVRERLIPMRTFGKQHYNWHEMVATAIFHVQEGERIVAIIEEGH